MSGGQQRLIWDLADLTPAERAELPAALVQTLQAWSGARSSLPPALSWAHDSLRVRRPVLERSQHDDRVYWSLRYAPHGDPQWLKGACLGTATGGRAGCIAPEPLGWLARTFGTADLCSEWSGTAPWGLRLRDIDPRRFFDDMLPSLPPAALDWWVVYEVDGDWVALDPEAGQLHWLGGEWTGEAAVGLPVPWVRAVGFILWRLLDGGALRPTDLQMLA